MTHDRHWAQQILMLVRDHTSNSVAAKAWKSIAGLRACECNTINDDCLYQLLQVWQCDREICHAR